MRTYELFINGEFIPNGDREMLQVLNPATEEVISGETYVNREHFEVVISSLRGLCQIMSAHSSLP